MHKEILQATITALFAANKGLLAMDESTPTCNKRFEAAGIPQTVEMRRQYRELIVTTPGLEEAIGGAILFDETTHQHTKDGTTMLTALLQKSIIPGIKVDEGTISMAGFPGEKITVGLDGLAERLQRYQAMGARFAKWRAVINIGNHMPTTTCLHANAQALAQYALICQQADMMPIVEPEVLMEGDHSLQRCYEVTQQTQQIVFERLAQVGVMLEGMILKPNMVTAGAQSSSQASVQEVAAATMRCLQETAPKGVPAIAFLSGGQTPAQASAHLSSMHQQFGDRLPWILSFSFARAIQQPALEAWKGQPENVKLAQQCLYQDAIRNVQANQGAYGL